MKNMESLVDSTYRLNIGIHLLQLTRCDKLTRLDISLADHDGEDDDDIDIYKNRNLLPQLINDIHNAPSLENLSLSETAIKLMDTKNLHNSLPKLESVVLVRIYLYHDDSTADITTISPKTLESFSLLRFAILNGREMATDASSNWISYIGSSYKSLKALKLEAGILTEAVDVENARVQGSSKNAIINWMQIKSLSIDFFLLPGYVLKLMDKMTPKCRT